MAVPDDVAKRAAGGYAGDPRTPIGGTLGLSYADESTFGPVLLPGLVRTMLADADYVSEETFVRADDP